MRRILDLPFIVVLMGISAAMMAVPMAHAVVLRDWQSGRAFFYSMLLFLVISGFLGLATMSFKPRSLARSHLTALLAAFTLLPAMLAVPFYEAVGNTSFGNAWFEMVSSMTTTGATLFEPERLTPTQHLWRGIVAWMGGFLIWVAAAALLAPMNLGGFEVISPSQPGIGARRDRTVGMPGSGDARKRLVRYALRLFPPYLGLTLLLWILLVMAGERPTVGIIHAMSVLSTSGISPVGGLENASAGFLGEVMIFLFFGFALTRASFSADFSQAGVRRLVTDPEARIGLFCIILVPCILFLRHWVGALEVDMIDDLPSALGALWGAVFSVASFLSTAGFTSAEWETARAWSGLETSGLILLSLALIGGGVATTAGGVKLLRVYALYTHGVREMERLVHPHSIGGQGAQVRRIRRQGAYVAWLFFMLFALSLTLVAVSLAATGVAFDEAMVLTVASLSTTGPAAAVATDTPVLFTDLDGAGKAITATAMVLGRLETLAIIALFNPAFWRS